MQKTLIAKHFPAFSSSSEILIGKSTNIIFKSLMQKVATKLVQRDVKTSGWGNAKITEFAAEITSLESVWIHGKLSNSSLGE